MVPREYQKTGIDFIRARDRCLLADDMGLGKTFQALRGTARARRLLVICPGQLRSQWLAAVLAERPHAMAIRSAADLSWLDCSNAAVCSYELATRHVDLFLRQRWGAVIFDESHYLKDFESARTLAMLGSERSPGVIGTARRAVFLSGTPIMNDASELFTIASRCAPRVLERLKIAGFHAWCRKFCVITPGFRGEIFRPREVRNEALLLQVLDEFWLRRRKIDVLSELPALTRDMVDCEIDETMDVLIERENGQLRETPLDRAEDVFNLTPLATLRREIGAAKMSFVFKRLALDLREEQKALVFPLHHDAIDRLSALLTGARVKHGVIDGRRSQLTRASAVHDFMFGKSRVLIAQIQAAGTGIDGLQASCSLVYFPEAVTVPALVNQAVSRVHRWGQKVPVLYRCFQVPDSLDARLWSSCSRKDRHVGKIL